MPLTAEQIAAVKLLADADATEVADALKNDANTIYNRVFGAGVKTGKEAEKASKATLQEQLDAEKTARETAETALQEARNKVPDAEKLNADWQAKYDRDVQAAKQATEAERQARQQEREARKLSDLRAHLTGLDPEYAAWKATEAAKRLRVKDDGAVELLEAGSEIPVQVPAGKTPYAVLAEEIVRGAPAGLRLSNADSGAGTQGGGGGRSGVTAEQIEQEKRASGAYTF